MGKETKSLGLGGGWRQGFRSISNGSMMRSVRACVRNSDHGLVACGGRGMPAEGTEMK